MERALFFSKLQRDRQSRGSGVPPAKG